MSNLATDLWTIAVGALCSVSCALLGCYLVLRRLSLLGDAISHAVLPGIALAFFFTGKINGLPIFFGAMAIGVLTTFLIQMLHSVGKVPEDASMGIAFTSLFALGVVMITRFAANVDLDPGCVLYGLIEFAPSDLITVLGFDIPRAMVTLGLALVLTLAFILVFWKELKIVSFDPGLATAMGFSATLIHYLLMAMVAGVTVASFEAVGSILVVAMLIVPGAAAHLLTDRLWAMMAWSAAIAIVSAVGGYYGAVHLNTSVAGMMAVVAGLQFGLIVLLAPRYGLVSKVVHNLALSLRIAGEDILALLYRQQETQPGVPAAAQTPAPARPMGARPIVNRLAAARLWQQGLVRAAEDRWELTPKGLASATSLVRSHRLWEKYLEEKFVLPLDHLHDVAERMEHYIGPELQSQLESELHRPTVDPHGRAIPRDDAGDS